jgi:hypothetical protein
MILLASMSFSPLFLGGGGTYECTSFPSFFLKSLDFLRFIY